MDNNPPSPSRRHGNEDEQDPQNVPLPDSRPESTTTVGQNATLSSQSPRAPPKLDDLETSEDIQSPPPALVTNEVQPEMSHANPPSFPCVAIAVPSSTPPPAATTEKSDSLAARLMKSISSLHLARDPNGIHIVHFPVGGSSSGTTHKKQKHSTKKSNYIRTTKYTVLTFLPLNLYFQFSRVYNVYFLLGALSTLGGTSSISPASMILPLLIVLLFSAIKDAYEDYNRYCADKAANTTPCHILQNGQRIELQSMYLQAGDILYLVKGEKAPVDAMILSTAYEDGTCFVETAELDGETNLKRRTALTELCTTTTPESVSALKGRIECEQPNENLHKFNGRLIFQSPESQGEISKSLNMDHLILRGAVLRNTDFAYAIVVYTGSDTKIIKNLKPAKAKTSTLERQLNYFVGGAFVFNAFLLISSVVIDYVGFIQILNLQKERQLTEPYDYAIAWYIGPVQDSAATELKNSILSYFALYSYVIPISLFVTMEVVRLVQGMFMTWDKKMESTLTSDDGSPPKVIAMRANNTNLNEEMAQLDYIFSDKTGTFTKNEMKLARWFVDETVYDEMNESGSLGRAMQDPNTPKHHRKRLQHFALILATCHGVIPSIDPKTGRRIYESQSPDETALVSATSPNTVTLLSRNKSQMVLDFFGKEVIVDVVKVLDFNSTRKRMSIIIKTESGYELFCKGADNVIEERLDRSGSVNDPALLKMTEDRLNEFSDIGLRTLMVAWRRMTEAEYKAYCAILDEAENAIDDREERVMEAYETVEKDLIYAGCTAIEDKLQDDLPETIEYLLNANIRIWLLTGDKVGTAINIGMSSKLINPQMNLLVLGGETAAESEANMDKMIADMASLPPTTIFALVVPGDVLATVFSGPQQHKFLQIGTKCHSVICARVSPLQKALVVKLVRDNEHAITLAIGDGANDVSMIQAAHVGVGIMGREGTQAVRAADYAFGEFRHLRRLVTVHGRYSLLRMTGLIYYSFYKNLVFITIQWWFGFVSDWTGQTAYEEIFFTAYNVIFTSLPPFFYAIFEKDVTEKDIRKYPELYHEVQKGSFWNWKLHLTMMFSSFWHSLLIFGAVYFINYEGTSDVRGLNTGYWVQCYLFSTPLLFTVLVKHALISKRWIWVTWAALFVSVALNLIIMFFVQVLTPNISYSDSGTALIEHVLPTYYILTLLLPAFSALPDLLSMYFHRQFWPLDVDIIMEEEILAKRSKGTSPSDA